MRQTWKEITDGPEQPALMDRIEDAVLSVNPDFWLGSLLVAVLTVWLGRLI